MSAVVIKLPNPRHLSIALQAVRTRAAALGASYETRRHALSIAIREMQAGRSTAAAVALANSSMRPLHAVHDDGPRRA